MEFNFKVDKDLILSLLNTPTTTNLPSEYCCPHPSGLKSYVNPIIDCLQQAQSNQIQPTPTSQDDHTTNVDAEKNEEESSNEENSKEENNKEETKEEQIFDRILKPLGMELDEDLKEMLKELEKGSLGEVLTEVTDSVESIYKVPIHGKEMANGLSDCLKGFEKYADFEQKENLSLFQQSLDHFKDCRTVGDLIKLFTKLQSKTTSN